MTAEPAAEPPPPAAGASGPGRSALLVGLGIFLSRVAGLVRQAILARFLGNGLAADAFTAALRIPNFLQNLLGEGVLSAAFIPVYSKLLSRNDREEAAHLASVVGTMLALVTSVVVLLGILAAPLLVHLLAPGFEGERRDLTVRLVRIVFPGVGILVMSAWCLGILNSHRRFFLSYVAPVIWNAAIIVALVGAGSRVGEASLAVVAAWASVAGAALQLAVQLPTVLRLSRGLRPSVDAASAHVRVVGRSLVPVVFGRGVVQVSAFVDTIIASLLPGGAVAAVSLYAQQISMLPVSLFGMAVSAAELPAMASAAGDRERVAAQLRARLQPALRQIAFLVVPSAVAFLALGDVIVAALYQRGRFTRADTIYVWGILAGSAVGVLASTLGRLYASTYYALHDTRTPVRFAMVRVGLNMALGYLLAVPLPPLLGMHPRWGAAGLTLASGMAAWVEYSLLRSTLNRRIGETGIAAGFLARLWTAAAAAAALGWGVKLLVGLGRPVVLTGIAVLLPYGAAYFALTAAMGLPESRAVLRRLGRRLSPPR